MTTAQLIGWVKRNPIAMSAGSLSLGLAIAIFIRSDAVPQANALLDAKSTEARRYDLNLTNATQLKEQYDTLATANKEIQARLIHPSQLGINQQYFYKLESQYGVKLTEIRQGSSTPSKSAVISVGFSVNVQGDFASVIGFLQGLEQGPHFCRVLTASCFGDRKGPVTLVLTLELLGQS